MKRSLLTLLFALLLAAPAADATAAKWPSRKQLKEVEVHREMDGAKRVTAKIARDRKQVGAPPAGDPKHDKAAIKIGPPIERKLKKAKGKVFDLRTLPSTRPRQKERPERHGPEPIPVMAEGTTAPTTPDEMSALKVPVRMAAAPAPIITFEGLDRFNWGAGSPPDTTGDVGPDHYIQAVNTSVGVYRKTDGFQLAAFTFDTLMSQGNFGNLCDTDNFGDPVILYDTFEDRWVLTDFAFVLDGGGNVNPPVAYQCFAVSMNGDPVSGGWNFYSIEMTDGLHDYEKLGVWSDGIYMSANMFGFPAGSTFFTARAWAINKAQMYAGEPTVQIVSFDLGAGDFTVVPSNARLQTGTPPPGRPNLFMSTWNFLNAVTVYKFQVDWASIGNSTFTGPDTPLAATSWPNAAVANVPQSGTAQLLDSLQIRAMVQNQYTNMGGAESLWIPHTVRRGNTTGFAAPRWYQVDVTAGTVNPVIPQAATWDPDAANVMHRFMPSLAIDRVGNMALAYSTSSSTTFPSIKYAGRLASDPINTFSQTEQTMLAGTASQTSSARWGDYSSVMLDPDGCTFWITNQYANPSSQTFDQRWLTRIGSFTYPECTAVGAGGTLSGTVTATVGGAPIVGATVELGSRTTTTNGSGFYSFTNLPAGTYPEESASAPGFITSTVSSIVITDGGTTTQDFSLATAPLSACPTDTTQADFEAGVGTNVDLASSPGDVTLASPDIIDQQTTNFTTSGLGFSDVTLLGQTFTPATTGAYTRIDVNIFCSGCSGANPNIILELRPSAGGNLVDMVAAPLATSTIAGTSSGSGGFLTFTFAVPPTLNAATQYGFVVKLAAARTGTQAILRSNTNTILGGRRNTCTTASCSLGATDTDLVFIGYTNTGFAASGNLVSSLKDSNPSPGLTPTWSTITWNGTAPTDTTLGLQVAGSNSPFGPFNFVGPDGTAATFFTSGSSLSQFYNLRYLKYKASLATTDSAVTPTLNDVTLCYTNTDCSTTVATITPTPAQVCASSTGNTASGPAGMTSYAWSIANGTIVGSATSQSVTYTAGASGTVDLTLAVVAANSCQASSTSNITINPIPATPTITPGGPTTFCVGGSVTLNSSSASGNQWLLNGNPIGGAVNQAYVATAAGDYTVIVSASGCSSAPSSATTVTVNPAPPAVVVTTPRSLPIGSTGHTASVVAIPGATYVWSATGVAITGGQGTNQITFNAGLPGTKYTVSVVITESDGCVHATSSRRGMTDFTDVPPSNPFHSFVVTLFLNDVTAGCGTGLFCPNSPVLREQMAVFLLVAKYGSTYTPPVPGATIFADVADGSPFRPWIEDLYTRNITAGCATSPLRFCPTNAVIREHMAVFLLVTEEGTSYTPPVPGSTIFADVADASPFRPWIEDIYSRGITSGCATSPLRFCPTNTVIRQHMAVFLTVTFGLNPQP